MADEDAEKAVDLLRRAEVLHYAIEAQPEMPADYGAFWHYDKSKKRPWSKGRAPNAKYADLDQAQAKQMELWYDIMSEVERIDARYRSRERESRNSMNAGHSGGAQWLPKSARFF